jgi:hypothetical protein
MSLADQASLLLIPTGYKSQKVYSIFPTDGDGDFDFSRSSSATRIAKNGLITTVAANVPRLNYPLIDGVVSGCPSLLLEPQRTNLITYSEDLTQSWWFTNTADVVLSTNLSPDGTQNAYKVTYGTSGNRLGGANFSLPNTPHTNSIYMRKISGSGVVDFKDQLGGSNTVNLTEDWQRYTITTTLTDGTARLYIDLQTLNDVIEVYGAQQEEGSYPTSYIPTNGTTVTRLAETAAGAGNADTFNDSEGVLLWEASALANDGTNRSLSISDGSTDNKVEIRYSLQADNRLRYIVSLGGVTQVDISNSNTNLANALLFNRLAIKYKVNDFSLWANGFKLDIDTGGDVPIGLDELSFDRGDGQLDFHGNTKQLQYHNSALTDSELETLTSWTSFTDMAQGQLYTIE